MSKTSRRWFLGASGAAVVLGYGAYSKYDDDDTPDDDEDEESTVQNPDANETVTQTPRNGEESSHRKPKWVVDESPTGMDLFDVVSTKKGAYAVGEGGLLLAHCHIGWATVLKMGPSGDGNPLYDIDVTDNGRVVWFTGGSGAIGRYDVIENRLEDYTAPREKTSSWTAIATDGLAGRERVFVVNGSGELLQGKYHKGTMTWQRTIKPDAGSTAEAVAFGSNGFGYIADSGGHLYKTVDDDEWNKIGIAGTSNTLFDVSPFRKEQLAVCAENGQIYRYNGFDWTELDAGPETLYAIQRGDRSGLAVGEEGAIYKLTVDGWKRDNFRAPAALNGVTLGAGDQPPVAVGIDGTIVRREPGER